MDTKTRHTTCHDTILTDQTSLLEQLTRHWRHAIADEFPVSMFLIDVDKFSLLENKSECFEQILEAIRLQFHRETDFITCFNRKQILAISSHMSFQQTALLAEKLHEATSSLKIFHPKSPTGRYATISIGHTTYSPADGDNYGLLDMLTTAQQHLEQAKQSGGNCSKTRLHSRVFD